MAGEAAGSLNVLFVCTGNSARSIMAEALLNHLGRDRFRAYSAGSFPAGRVNPLALELLAAEGIEAQGARSKSWDEFAQPGAPQLDLVVTVCDRAAGESCPAWPGNPPRRHWDIADPTIAQGGDDVRRQAFRAAFRALEQRIRELVANW